MRPKLRFEFACITRCLQASITGSVTVFLGPPMPGPVKLFVRSEEPMSVLVFSLSLPPAGAPDVVKRELSIKIGDAAPTVTELDGGQVLVEGLRGPQDAALEVSLIDIDDAGNRSEARVQQFALKDTVAPPEPGEMSLKVTGEEADPISPATDTTPATDSTADTASTQATDPAPAQDQ
jgi:hypothetical protein